MISTTLRLMLVAASVILTGCTTTQKPAVAAQEKEEYTYITETGSRIPTKVKKGKTKSDAHNSEQGDSRTLEQLQRDQTLRTMRRDGS